MEILALLFLFCLPVVFSLSLFVYMREKTKKEKQELDSPPNGNSPSQNLKMILVFVIAAIVFITKLFIEGAFTINDLLSPLSILFYVSFILTLSPILFRCRTSKKEREEQKSPRNSNLQSQNSKAIWGFDIVAIIFFSIVLLLSIPELPHRDGDLLVLIVITPLIILSFIPIFASVLYGYDYLFYVKSNLKSFFILAIPFIGLLPTLILPSFNDTWIAETETLGIVILSDVIILATMSIFLFVRRKNLMR